MYVFWAFEKKTWSWFTSGPLYTAPALRGMKDFVDLHFFLMIFLRFLLTKNEISIMHLSSIRTSRLSCWEEGAFLCKAHHRYDILVTFYLTVFISSYLHIQTLILFKYKNYLTNETSYKRKKWSPPKYAFLARSQICFSKPYNFPILTFSSNEHERKW